VGVRFSFIVTSWNIEEYIGPCLDRLAPCLQPGDQLIVVDDGSEDCSCEEITAALDRLEGRGVALCPVFLGANTHGGVGIPANIGLDEATGDAIFFIDGDDWVDAEGLRSARRRFEAMGGDILIANYRVYDAGQGRYEAPPDQPLWAQAHNAATLEDRRHLALQMVGVPWRKIYRTDFLRSHNIRFPEGPFFYEDNPFHWAVVLAAAEIGFLDVCVCSHRIGRAGQTMAARGTDLAAFFDHYDRIVAQMQTPQYRADALRWLLENMAWHIERLAPEAQWIYAARAEETLASIAEADWQAMRRDPVALRAWGVARALASGDLANVIAGWEQKAVYRQLQDLQVRLGDMERSAAWRGEQLDRLTHWSDGQRAVQEFRALKALRRARWPADADGDG